MRTIRPAALLAAVAALACGPRDELPDVSSVDFSGVFVVEGRTVEQQAEVERPIRGTVIIARRDAAGAHVVTFDLETELATPEGGMQAEVIGSAEASVGGGALEGEAETRILLGTVPGVDPSFPFVPAHLGARIVSRFRMTPDAEVPGAFRIEIESAGAEGEAYDATRTVLAASREAEVSDAPLRSVVLQRGQAN